MKLRIERSLLLLMLATLVPALRMAQAGPAATPSVTAAAPAESTDKEEFKPPPPWVTLFARGGQEMRVSLDPRYFSLMTSQVVLTAFGRTWSKPADVAVTSTTVWAHMAVPKVRVTTVFSILRSSTFLDLKYKGLAGELVVYPDQNVAWDEKIVLYSCGTPAWFNQWATATGLPLKTITPAELPSAELGQVGEDTKTLLILSPSAIGRRDPDYHLVKLANEKAVNILILADTPRLGNAAGPVALSGGQMRGDLLAITGKQTWASALEFRSHRQPCGMIANRWAWIAYKDGLPLVESVADGTAPPETARSVVLSYLSWEDQLGRREEADATLLAILSAAAKAEPPKIAGHPVEFIYPKKTELNAKERPVLSAVRSVEPVPRKDGKPDYNPPIYYILDLRGKEEIRYPDGDLSEICRRSIEDRQPICELIILGDDKMLDEWKWLKLDRAKKLIAAAGVQWLPDDDLPPSKESQIRLMLKLTELGVPLGPPQQEEERK